MCHARCPHAWGKSRGCFPSEGGQPLPRASEWTSMDQRGAVGIRGVDRHGLAWTGVDRHGPAWTDVD